MSKLKSFFKQSLSKDEMIEFRGGVGTCSCQCSSIRGAWTGTYSNGDQVITAGWNYCGDGGYSCQCNWTPEL